MDVPSATDKILEVVGNTPEWKIEIKECSIERNCYPQLCAIIMGLKTKVYDETPLLFVYINEKTLDTKFDPFNYIGHTFSFYTAQNYPVESARVFAAALFGKALCYKYCRTVAPYVRAEVQKRGRKGIFIYTPLYLYPSLDEPYIEGWAYLHHYFTKTNFCTLRFTAIVRPRQPEVTIYCHPHGFGNYEDVTSYTTDMEGALNLIPKLVALYFI